MHVCVSKTRIKEQKKQKDQKKGAIVLRTKLK